MKNREFDKIGLKKQQLLTKINVFCNKEIGFLQRRNCFEDETKQ